MLLALQIFHTFVALVNFAALFYMLYAHWSGKRTRLLKFCYFVIVVEAIVIIPFGLSCPISLWVKHNYPLGTPDILIPKWVSKRLIEWGSVLLTIGLTPLGYRWLRARRVDCAQ